MELNNPNRSLSVLATILCVTFGTAFAAYHPTVILKYPVGMEHADALGNAVFDSLARNKPLTATLYKIGMSDSVTVEGMTNDSGLSALHFDRWQASNSIVESAGIQRLDISFPGTWRATKIAGRFHFEPLRMDRTAVTGRPNETLLVLLPLSVTPIEDTIGSGNFSYDFAVLSDCHIAGSKKTIDGREDFGVSGYDDWDSHDPADRTIEIQEDSACVDYINDSFPDVRFVALTGDITQSAERSEFQRAREVFSAFNEHIFVVPLMGNHDGWPYVGHGLPFANYIEQPSDSVVIGKYFLDSYRGVYDTLRAFLPAADWQASNLLMESTSVTGQTWPSFYDDFAFNYQGSKFIATDFCTRDKAFPDNPGLYGYPETDMNEDWDYTWDWLHGQVAATPSGERIICLGHHAYFAWGASWWRNFTADELHRVSDAGLLNNTPIAFSIGGHIHPFGDQTGRSYYGDGTICDYHVANPACEGHLYIFHVRDNVQLQVSHTWGSYPSRTVQFTANYSYQGSQDSSVENCWDFGDGYVVVASQQFSHEYDGVDHDTTYKVSLRITTASGRHVWVCDTGHHSLG